MTWQHLLQPRSFSWVFLASCLSILMRPGRHCPFNVCKTELTTDPLLPSLFLPLRCVVVTHSFTPAHSKCCNFAARRSMRKNRHSFHDYLLGLNFYVPFLKNIFYSAQFKVSYHWLLSSSAHSFPLWHLVQFRMINDLLSIFHFRIQTPWGQGPYLLIHLIMLIKIPDM